MIGYLFILATTLLYFYVLKKFQYFKNKGIPYQPGYFPLGSSITWKALSGQVAFFGIPDEIYKIYPEHKVVSIMVNQKHPQNQQHVKANLLYMSRAVSNFYGTEIKIWAGFGPVGNTEKKFQADYELFLMSVLSCFQWQIFF